MEKKSTFLPAILFLLAFIVPTLGAKAQTRSTATFEYTVYEGQGGEAGIGGPASATFDFIAIASTNACYYGSKNHIREYAGGTLTVTSNNGEAITEVAIACTGSSYMNYTSNVGTIVNSNGSQVWTGSSTEVVFTVGTRQCRWTSIVVTYGGPAMNTVATPMISPESGTYNAAQEVSITCETEGATIYYTTNGYAPTTNSTQYTGPFTISENNITVKAFATKEGMISSSVTSATYYFELPSTIAYVRSRYTSMSSHPSVFTSGVVTSISTNQGVSTAYIQDTTAAIVVYGEFDATVGDEILVHGSLYSFRGLMEIQNPTVSVISQNNIVEPTIATIQEINEHGGINNSDPIQLQSMLVRIENATVTSFDENSTIIRQGEDTITIFNHIISGVLADDVVSLTGNVGYFYQSQIVNPRDIVIEGDVTPSIIISPPSVTIVGTQHQGTLTVIYQDIDGITDVGIQWYEADGVTAAEYNWIEGEIDENLNVAYSVGHNTSWQLRTAYFKVHGVDANGDDIYSNLVTVTQDRYTDYATLPFTWEGGGTWNFDYITGAFTSGVGNYDEEFAPYMMKLDDTGDYILVKTNEQPGKVTIGVKMIGGGNTSSIVVQGSADGEHYTDIQTLTISGAQGSEMTLQTINAFAATDRFVRLYFNKGSNVGVGPISIVGVSSTPAITVVPSTLALDASEQEGLFTVIYENIETDNGVDVIWYGSNGYTLTEYDWISAEVRNDFNVGYSVAANNSGAERKAYFKVRGYNSNHNTVYSNLVGITQVDESQVSTYTLVNANNPLVSGKHYIIVAQNSDESAYFAMGAQASGGYGQSSNHRTAFEVSVNDNTISNFDTRIYEFVINGPEIITKDEQQVEVYTIYDPRFPGFLYSAGYSNNSLKTETHIDNGNNDFWTIEISDEGAATITAQGNNTRNMIRFNSETLFFSCYVGGLQDVYLYMKDNDTNFDFYKDVEGYGSGSGRYYFIASPIVSEINPQDCGLITNNNAQGPTCDLYSWDFTQEESEWRNYRDQGFHLENSKSYLYATKYDLTMHFQGESVVTENNVENIALDYSSETVIGNGWNFVGNPFTKPAYVDHLYYVLNDYGTEIIAASPFDAINPMEGFFMKADGPGETYNISTNPFENAVNELAIEVRQDTKDEMDRIIVRFGDGKALDKFMLDPDNTKLYFSQHGKDYAVVCSPKENEMPVHFKAAQDGTYVLSVKPFDAELSYLHLIDHLTGVDIDLLQMPEYTFTAKVDDKASRFSLVFKCK